MNIFVLDTDPIIAAQMQCDKHVVKMTLETAQLLCSAVIVNGGVAPYRLTHKNHPSTKWATRNRANFMWLIEHGKALAKEYTFRYGKEHKCEKIFFELEKVSSIIPDGKLENFALAMPNEYRSEDSVKSYRKYYVGEKTSFAKWTKRKAPDWFKL